MNFVEPIRDKEKIEEMKRILKVQSYRNYIMFLFGINTGLRISDILPIKAGQVKNRDFFYVDEGKTGKEREVRLQNGLKMALDEYTKNMDDETYLFSSQKDRKKPMLRQQAYRILNDASREAGIQERIGTHTLRKTFGYHYYKKTKDIQKLKDILNHSDEKHTKRYIGINKEEIRKSLEDFDL